MEKSSTLSIPAFYEGKNLFITGASGFLGQALLEKLLRSCPGIGKIYVLLREKRGQQATERVERLLAEVIFEKLLKENPSVKEKIVPIPGDITEPGLGISKEDAEILAKNTHIVVHSAATVRFNEPLKKAVNINLIGTRKMLQFCKQMRNLVAFVHVSTAYAHCPRSEIDEVFYPPPCDPQRAIDLTEWMDDQMLDSLAPSLLKEWPNTYTFTKALTEALVQEEEEIPIIVVRPSIVGPTWREPVPGWTNNLNGPIGIVIGGSKGIIRTMLGDNVSANIIPADIVANLIIAAAWYKGVHKPDDVLIFHGTAEMEKTMTWVDMVIKLHPYSVKYPSSKVYRYPGGSFKKTKFWNKCCQFYSHTLPAAVIDSYFYLRGKKPRFLKLYQKIHNATDSLAYFSLREWEFNKNNVEMLWNLLCPEDREVFNIRIDDLHLVSYWENCILGTRKYILKESYDTLPLARKKLTRLYIITQLTNIALAWGAVQLVLTQSEMAQQIWNMTIGNIYNWIF